MTWKWSWLENSSSSTTSCFNFFFFLLQVIVAEAQDEYFGNCQKNEQICKLFSDFIFSFKNRACVCVWSTGSLTNQTKSFLLLDLKAVLWFNKRGKKGSQREVEATLEAFCGLVSSIFKNKEKTWTPGEVTGLGKIVWLQMISLSPGRCIVWWVRQLRSAVEDVIFI